MRTIAPAIWYRWPYYRHWSTLPDDLLNRTLDELCDRDFRAIRATGSHWMQVVQRTGRWKVMWNWLRASLTWPLRHCVLQLELDTADTPLNVMDGEACLTVKLEIPFLDLSEVQHVTMIAASDKSTSSYTVYGDEIIHKRQMQGQLRKFTVVESARIYNRKTGRAHDLKQGGIGSKEPLEVETNRVSVRRAKEFEFRWCFDRGPDLRNAHAIEYMRDALREDMDSWASIIGPRIHMMEEFQGDDEDLKWMWDEAAAGELMMEQTLMSQLHHFEFCLNVEERPFFDEREQEEWQGLAVDFSINSVFPPPQRPGVESWQTPAYACFVDETLSGHLQVAAILLLLGEPLPWFPPGGHSEHDRRQADAAALANWLKKGSCRAYRPDGSSGRPPVA